MREHILSLEGFRALSRPTSKHLDLDEVDKYIEECEDVHIIPAVGLRTFQRLCGEDVIEGTDDHILLNGGEWEETGCGCGEDGELRRCYGLRKALAYFVYARMMQNDGSIMTRTGLMQHNDEYARRDDDKNRVRKYNEVMNIAEMYLSTCLEFIKHIGNGCVTKKVRGTRVRIKAVGD